MHAGKLVGLLGRELVDAIGGGGVKGIERVRGATGGRERLAHTGVKRTCVVARTGKVNGRAVGLYGVCRTPSLMKQRPRSPRAAAGAGLRIDGSLTEGGAGIGIIARLEQGVAQTQIALNGVA